MGKLRGTWRKAVIAGGSESNPLNENAASTGAASKSSATPDLRQPPINSKRVEKPLPRSNRSTSDVVSCLKDKQKLKDREEEAAFRELRTRRNRSSMDGPFGRKRNTARQHHEVCVRTCSLPPQQAVVSASASNLKRADNTEIVKQMAEPSESPAESNDVAQQNEQTPQQEPRMHTRSFTSQNEVSVVTPSSSPQEQPRIATRSSLSPEEPLPVTRPSSSQREPRIRTRSSTRSSSLPKEPNAITPSPSHKGPLIVTRSPWPQKEPRVPIVRPFLLQKEASLRTKPALSQKQTRIQKRPSSSQSEVDFQKKSCLPKREPRIPTRSPLQLSIVPSTASSNIGKGSKRGASSSQKNTRVSNTSKTVSSTAMPPNVLREPSRKINQNPLKRKEVPSVESLMAAKPERRNVEQRIPKKVRPNTSKHVSLITINKMMHESNASWRRAGNGNATTNNRKGKRYTNLKERQPVHKAKVWKGQWVSTQANRNHYCAIKRKPTVVPMVRTKLPIRAKVLNRSESSRPDGKPVLRESLEPSKSGQIIIDLTNDEEPVSNRKPSGGNPMITDLTNDEEPVDNRKLSGENLMRTNLANDEEEPVNSRELSGKNPTIIVQSPVTKNQNGAKGMKCATQSVAKVQQKSARSKKVSKKATELSLVAVRWSVRGKPGSFQAEKTVLNVGGNLAFKEARPIQRRAQSENKGNRDVHDQKMGSTNTIQFCHSEPPSKIIPVQETSWMQKDLAEESIHSVLEASPAIENVSGKVQGKLCEGFASEMPTIPKETYCHDRQHSNISQTSGLVRVIASPRKTNHQSGRQEDSIVRPVQNEDAEHGAKTTTFIEPAVISGKIKAAKLNGSIITKRFDAGERVIQRNTTNRDSLSLQPRIPNALPIQGTEQLKMADVGRDTLTAEEARIADVAQLCNVEPLQKHHAAQNITNCSAGIRALGIQNSFNHSLMPLAQNSDQAAPLIRQTAPLTLDAAFSLFFLRAALLSHIQENSICRPSLLPDEVVMLQTRKRKPNPPLAIKVREQNEIIAPRATNREPKPISMKTWKEQLVIKKTNVYSPKGFSRSLSEAAAEMKIPEGHRMIARIRRSDKDGNWGVWAPVTREIAATQEWECSLGRGGKLRFVPALVANISPIREEMGQCVFRQYPFRGGLHKEPRVHVLYSSSANEGNEKAENKPGYKYHGIRMQALPLNTLTAIDKLAHRLAVRFDLPNKEWNIGLDLLCYRDGQDGISWHADDTQGEEIVLSVVTESEGGPRTLCIQPSNSQAEQLGDEQIELFPSSGDGYLMDDEMQRNYVHSVMKCPKGKNATGRRMAIVFRHGRELSVPQDTGSEVVSTNAPDRSPPQYQFGHPSKLIVEGMLYSRKELKDNGAHHMERRGVSGNRAVGCNGIIVSKGHPAALLGSQDSYRYLSYAANSNQGAGALAQSMQKRLPIRVFRSSRGWIENVPKTFVHPSYSQSYALPFAPRCDGIKYRYDGLYYITAMEEDVIGGSIKEVTRFRLLRAEPIEMRDKIHTKLCNYTGRDLPENETIPEIVSRKASEEIITDERLKDFDLRDYTSLVNASVKN